MRAPLTLRLYLSFCRAFNLLTANVIALTLAVPKLPRMADEISEMLTQIKLMREDLQLMRSKVAWLPGS